MNKSIAFIIVTFAVTFLSVTSLFAQNLPPEEVEGIIQDMVVLEKYYEMKQWDKARVKANMIDNNILKVLVETELEAPSLEKALVRLKGSLLEANHKKAQVNYILFQKHFVTFLNNFYYEVHPILRMIERSVIAESDLAMSNKDYSDVVAEMAEAGNLIKHAKPILIAKGVSEEELAKFSSSVLVIIKATKQNDKNLVKEELEKMQVLYKSFLIKAT